MKLLNSVSSGLFTLSTLLLFGTTTTPPAQAGESLYGCPSGYVCIYGESKPLTTTPTNKYYRYGTYKLYNQYGYHFVVNNQTGGATVALCENSNGTRCEYITNVGAFARNLSPINSIKLME